MLVGIGTKGIETSAHIIEPKTNHEASDYVISNYNTLKAIIRRCDIKEEKAEDLLHDVFISLVESEQNGNGFDMEYGNNRIDGKDDICNIMDVEQFVIGRIKLYAKNPKYRTDIVEATNSFVHETDTYYETELDEQGHEVLNKDGTPKLIKKTHRHKVQVTVTSNAASFNEGGDVKDNNDDFQKAFATAATADSTEDITEMLSLRDEINYCIDVCSLHKINILNIFKNIDKLAEMLGDYSKKKRTAESVFSKLSELVSYHDELADSIMEVLRYASKNRAVYDLVMSTY